MALSGVIDDCGGDGFWGGYWSVASNLGLVLVGVKRKTLSSITSSISGTGSSG